jgi:hypothetical protein
MSTTFGIPIRKIDIELGNEDGLHDYISTEFFEKVWLRSYGIGGCSWLNPLGELLPDDTKVYALDNSQQGVYTIGDIKEIMNNQNK